MSSKDKSVIRWLNKRSLGLLANPISRYHDDTMLLGSMKCYRRDKYLSIGPTLHSDNPEPPTYVMKFCPVPGYQEILGLANEDGKMAFQNTAKPRKPADDNTGFMKGLDAHKNAILDFTWSPNSVNRIVTVSGDNTVVLWDLSQARLNKVQTFKGHTRSIKCVEAQPNSSSVFASGKSIKIRFNKTCVPSMIHSTRPTVPPVAITILP